MPCSVVLAPGVAEADDEPRSVLHLRSLVRIGNRRRDAETATALVGEEMELESRVRVRVFGERSEGRRRGEMSDGSEHLSGERESWNLAGEGNISLGYYLLSLFDWVGLGWGGLLRGQYYDLGLRCFQWSLYPIWASTFVFYICFSQKKKFGKMRDEREVRNNEEQVGVHKNTHI